RLFGPDARSRLVTAERDDYISFRRFHRGTCPCTIELRSSFPSFGSFTVRLATISTTNGDRIAALRDGKFIDLQAPDPSPPLSLKELLALDDGVARARAAAEEGLAAGRLVTGRLLAPVQAPGKVICIGLNYRDHARESGMEPPPEPV